MANVFDSRSQLDVDGQVSRQPFESTLQVGKMAVEPADGSLVATAVDFVNERFSAIMPDGCSLLPVDYGGERRTSSGVGVVRLGQLMKDIPVFQSELVLRIGSDLVPLSIAGTLVQWAEAADSTPGLSVEEAVVVAAKYLAERLDWKPQDLAPLQVLTVAVVSSGPIGEDRLTILTAGSIPGPIEARLRYFDYGTRLRLTWHVTLVMPEPGPTLVVLVDAHDAEVVWASNVTPSSTVYGRLSFPDPDTQQSRHAFPQPASRYSLPDSTLVPEGFPREDWSDGEHTVGNNALVADEDGVRASTETVNGEATFRTIDQVDLQQVTASYAVNFAHDYFWLLGFREADGNFQSDNHDLGGSDTDAVRVVLYPWQIKGTATMDTFVDGKPPLLQLGLRASSGRHTAMDASVIIHEYTHGVVSRLIGGSDASGALGPAQSAALSEAWSDFFGCAMTGVTASGGWTNPPGGFRSARYDDQNTDTYQDFAGDDPHRHGEPWAAALMDLARALTPPVAMQVVLDALKTTPVAPTFVQARDAVLQSLQDYAASSSLSPAETRANLLKAWQAFAKHGLGVDAVSGPASVFTKLTPSFSTPTFEPEAYADSGLEAYEAGSASVGHGPATCSWGPGRLDVFCATSTGVIHTWVDPQQDLGYWESINGADLGAGRPAGAAACSAGEGDLDVFEIAADGTLHWLRHDPVTGWGLWANLGGDLDPSAAPGAASWATGRVDVFARGNAGQLMHIWSDAVAGWRGWEILDQQVGAGFLSGGVSVTATGPGKLLIAGQNEKRRLITCAYDDALGTWTPWNLLGAADKLAVLQGGPATLTIPGADKPQQARIYAINAVPGATPALLFMQEPAWTTEGIVAPAGTYVGLAGVGRTESGSPRVDLVVSQEVPHGDLYRVGSIRHLWGPADSQQLQHEDLPI